MGFNKNDMYASKAAEKKITALLHENFGVDELFEALSGGAIKSLNKDGDKLVADSFDEVEALAKEAESETPPVVQGKQLDDPIGKADDPTGDPANQKSEPDEIEMTNPNENEHPRAQADNPDVADRTEAGEGAEGDNVADVDGHSVDSGSAPPPDTGEKPREPDPVINPESSMPTHKTIRDEKTGQMRKMTVGELQDIARDALIAENINQKSDEDTPLFSYFTTKGSQVGPVVYGGVKPQNGPNGSFTYPVHRDILDDWKRLAPVGRTLFPSDSDGNPLF